MNRESNDLKALRRTLLHAARADAPPVGTKSRALVALGVATAATGVTGSAAATTAAKLVALKWFLGGALITASAIGTLELTQGANEAPPVSAPVRVEREKPATVSSPIARQVDAGSDARDDATPAPRVTAAVSAKPGKDRSAGLTREIALLDEARAAIQSGTPEKGLEALSRYEAECGDAQLGHEATALRVQALQRSGRCDDAARVGQSFLHEHPSSPVAKRIRTLLAECPAGESAP